MFDYKTYEERKQILIEMILKNAYRYSIDPPFKLTSGNTSPYYFDCKQILLNPIGSILIGKLFYRHILKDFLNEKIEGIGGLTLGADPLSAAISFRCILNDRFVSQFIIRKEPKKHGTKNYIETILKPGAKVIIVDDVVTTGSSTIKAIERAKEFGFDVRGVMILIDRQEFNGIKNIQNIVPDIKIISLVKREEVTSYAENTEED